MYFTCEIGKYLKSIDHDPKTLYDRVMDVTNTA